MPRYSEERKTAVLKKLLPPTTAPYPKWLGRKASPRSRCRTGESQWRRGARKWQIHLGSLVGEAKFAAVVETAMLNEHDLSEYCRSKGLYPEQIQQWKVACIQGAGALGEQQRIEQQTKRQQRKQVKRLERELQRKEKALAEAAALLVLRKKLNALWEGGEDE